jgi:TetR/AcrR family transcriptional regulator, transcriptional repressor for nem operon
MGRTSDARERLVAAAVELFYARGYQGVGIDELCERAGVRKGSFYYFFPSKRDLVLAALDHRWKLAKEYMVAPILGGDVPPLERIRRFFAAIADASTQEKSSTGECGGCAFGNLSAEMSSHDAKIRQRVRKVFDEIAGYVETALEQAVECGEAPGIKPPENARALVAYMEGLLLLARTHNDPGILRRLGHKAVDLAIARPDASGPPPESRRRWQMKVKKKGKRASGAPDALFASITEPLLKSGGVTSARMFGSNCLKVSGKVFVVGYKGRLVLKLPAERVQQLVASGRGVLFDPGHGRTSKEWVSVAPESRDAWLRLATDAREFVASL